MLVFIVVPYAKDGSQVNEVYISKLKDWQKQYEWAAPATNQTYNEATRLWDYLQQQGCCGVDSPQDWNAYRPKMIQAQFYPRSCCSKSTDKSSNLCEDNGNLYRLGCRMKVYTQEQKILWFFISIVIIQIILSLSTLAIGIFIKGMLELY